MALKRTVDAISEPLTYSDAKIHLRLSDDTDQTTVENLIKVSRYRVEQELGRSILTQTWRKTMDSFPSSDEKPIVLSFPPVQSVSSIVYTDTNGVLQTLSASKYLVDADSDHPRISLAYNQTWPDTYDQKNVVTVTYIAGYLSVATVPANWIHAIKLLTEHYYDERGNVSDSKKYEIPGGVRDLLKNDAVTIFE